jgi:hypothetical protein
VEKKVLVGAGDEFFFREECIAHETEVIEGVRGLADFFTHKNVLDWCEKEKNWEKRHK